MGFIVSILIYCNMIVDPAYEAPPPLKINSPHVVEMFAIGAPQQKAEWIIKPTIRVCASAEVPFFRVQRAMRYWEKNGYIFDGVVPDSSPACAEPRFGEIIVTLPEGGFSDAHLASTRLYVSNKTGEILKAKIHILPKHARKERVLEHEMGHALGWSHYRQRYHIMHPTWAGGGYDSYGIRKR